MKENAPLRRQKDIKSDHLTYVYMHASEDENIQPLTDTVEKFLLSTFFWSPTTLGPTPLEIQRHKMDF